MDCETIAYIWLTDLLGLPRNDSKDCQGTVVIVFGIERDTSWFTARLPTDKLEKAIKATLKVLSQKAVSFIDIQSLVGFLSFCSQAVRLGRVFMRRLWDFINHYPRGGPKSTLRRIPTWVREDLEWWNKLLPTYNGVLFFDTRNRETQTLYNDACLYGLGGFYFKGRQTWEQVKVTQSDAFCAVVQGKTLPANRKMKKNPDDPSINVHEIEAILLAFQLWAPRWSKQRLRVFTDSTTAFSGLREFTLKSPPNAPLREIWLLAAKWDIVIEAHWIEGRRNGLADALSRFDKEKLIDLCPHWQNPSYTMTRQSPTYPPPPGQPLSSA